MDEKEHDYWAAVGMLMFCIFMTWIFLSTGELFGVFVATVFYILTIMVAILLGMLIYEYWPDEVLE